MTAPWLPGALVLGLPAFALAVSPDLRACVAIGWILLGGALGL